MRTCGRKRGRLSEKPGRKGVRSSSLPAGPITPIPRSKLLTSLGLAVLSEDSVFEDAPLVKVNVLNQWTYHARLYRAAEYVSRQKDMNLVQLVSFGCGIDAITTDEVRSILEKNGKLYTQIKIDEINNLGVVRIRLRSMLAAIEEQNAAEELRGTVNEEAAAADGTNA